MFALDAPRLHAWTNVLPITPGSKRPPMGLTWRRWQQVRQSSDDLAALMHTYPSADVGVILGGPGRLCDIETDSPDGDAHLHAMNLPLPPSACWRSPRGVHRLYRARTALPSRLHLRPGLDVLSGGRYAIAPTSAGREWILGLEALAQLPDAWHEVLRAPRRHTLADVERDGAVDGARNVTLTRLCGRWISAGKTDAEVIAAAVRWRHSCTPPLDDAEALKVARSVLALRAQSRSAEAAALFSLRDRQDLSPVDRVTLLALVAHQQDLGRAGEDFAAPMRLMAGLVGMDYRSLTRIYRRLEAAGLIALLPGRDPTSGRRVSTVRFRP